MQIDILSLFPGYFQGPFHESILKRAREKNLLGVSFINIRDFAEGKHKQVDDKPFGGGPGMLMSPDPVVKAIRSVKKETSKVIYLTPQGKVLNAKKCESLAKEEHIILLCGHYEGVDERVMIEVDEQISIGDYVLTSGCPAAIVLVDSMARFIPGVIGHPEGVKEDSFQDNQLEGPQYTRPRVFEGMKVPEVLLEGNHKKIKEWRQQQGKQRMEENRPDLCQNELQDR